MPNQTEQRATKLEVKMLSFTKNPLTVIYAACRQCYSSQYAGDVFMSTLEQRQTVLDPADLKILMEKESDLIRKIIESGHNSVIEHVSFTFAVQGISRALSHQLVRHRIGVSFSQQSQRYVAANNFTFLIPPKIEKSKKAKQKFLEVMDYLGTAYTEIHDLLIEEGHEKTANEDARFVLPNAAETKLVFTMNCRALLNFLSLRCCNRAQWEIRALANQIHTLVSQVVPVIFEKAGAPCEHLGYCPEDPKFSCGKYRTKIFLTPFTCGKPNTNKIDDDSTHKKDRRDAPILKCFVKIGDSGLGAVKKQSMRLKEGQIYFDQFVGIMYLVFLDHPNEQYTKQKLQETLLTEYNIDLSFDNDCFTKLVFDDLKDKIILVSDGPDVWNILSCRWKLKQ